jgi:hypothetical protein
LAPFDPPLGPAFFFSKASLNLSLGSFASLISFPLLHPLVW